MYDLVTIGSVSVDLYFKGDSLTTFDGRFQLAQGGKYFSDFFYESVGGGAANVAIGAQKKGLRTSILSTIGNNDFKHFIRDALREDKVSDHYCKFKDDYNNISVILLTEKGEKTVINFQNKRQHLFANSQDFQVLKRAKSSFMANLPDISLEEKLKILNVLAQNDVFTFLNLGVKDCRRDQQEIFPLLEKPSVLLLNKYEFCDLVKKKYEDISLDDNVVDLYLPLFRDKILIITDGRKGSYGYFNNEVYKQPAPKIEKILDATGAGDGYTAGFIAEYYKTRDVVSAMERGSEYAGKILQQIGAN